MLTQEHGNKHTTACNLLQWAYAYPSHLKTTAATTKLVQVSRDVTLGNAIYLHTPHIVQSLLNSKLTQHFSASRLTYEVLLLSPPNLHLKCCHLLNPAVTTSTWWGRTPWLRANDVPFCDIASWFMRYSLTNRGLILIVDGSYIEMKKGIFKLVMLLLPNTTYLKGEISHKLNQPNKQSSVPLPKHASIKRTNCSYLYQ